MKEGRRNICVYNVYYLAYTWILPRDVAAILQNVGALGCSLSIWRVAVTWALLHYHASR